MLRLLGGVQPDPDPGPDHLPSWDATANTMADGVRRHRVDYVLFQEGYASPRSAVSRILRFRDEDDLDLSDHYPVLGTFEFEPLEADSVVTSDGEPRPRR